MGDSSEYFRAANDPERLGSSVFLDVSASLSSSSLSSDMPNFVRICGHVAFSGFEMSIGPGRIRSRSSTSPGRALLSTPWGGLDASGGISCRFVAGSLVVGAGGGGALFSAVFFSSSISWRFCRSRVASCSCYSLIDIFCLPPS